MREIVLDTETTGLDCANGDRLIEVGCVELMNRIPTGREFHRFLSPEAREVHPEAEAVHGLSAAFLEDKPLFRDAAADFLAFIGDAPLVIHNASFDVGFINAELQRVGMAALTFSRVVDTLALARRKHPNSPNSLDALCKRYGIDNTQRTKHGAIMDSLLLAAVYVELLGERQTTLELAAGDGGQIGSGTRAAPARARPEPLPARLTADEAAAHRAFVATLGRDALWTRYRAPAS